MEGTLSEEICSGNKGGRKEERGEKNEEELSSQGYDIHVDYCTEDTLHAANDCFVCIRGDSDAVLK